MNILNMSILNMSISGAVMILVIILIRAFLMNFLPKKTLIVLWGLVLVRLLIPYSIPSPLSVYSLAGNFLSHQEIQDAASSAYTRAGSIMDISNLQVSEAVGVTVPVMDVAKETAKEALTPAISINPYLAAWLAGFLGLSVFFIISYIRCRRVFRESMPVESEEVRKWLDTHAIKRTISIRYTDRISAPLTFGVLRPVILVPKTIPWSDKECMKYVLEHEYVHIRRFDALTKLLLASALCVHWFNPAVWVMYILANRDIELSCDEAVIRQLGEGSKSAYARILIRMEEIRSGLSPLCNNFSKNAIEERIVAIMKTKKYKFPAGIIAGILVILVVAGFATSAQTSAADVPDKPPVTVTKDAVQAMEGEMISYNDPSNGETYFSLDNGNTWICMTPEEYEETFGNTDVEWWTAEEYAEWLEQEKADLQAIVGDKGWNPTDGWYTWTQEMVDETIARYEQELAEIRNGMKLSKPAVSGDVAYQFSYDPDNIMNSEQDVLQQETISEGAYQDYDAGEDFKVQILEEDYSVAFGDADADHMQVAQELDRYAPFGVTFVENENYGNLYYGNLYYNGKLVEVLLDDSPDGIYRSFRFSDKGGIKLRTVYDSRGNLIGIEEIMK